MVLNYQELSSIKEILVGSTIKDVSGLVEEFRKIKSAKEIEYIRKACHIADKGMEAAINSINIGTNDDEVAAE